MAARPRRSLTAQDAPPSPRYERTRAYFAGPAGSSIEAILQVLPKSALDALPPEDRARVLALEELAAMIAAVSRSIGPDDSVAAYLAIKVYPAASGPAGPSPAGPGADPGATRAAGGARKAPTRARRGR